MTAEKSGAGFPGQAGLWAGTSDYNNTYFLAQQLLALVRTATLVQVKACTNNGELSPVGTVDVLPLVNMIDGIGTSSEHDTLYKLPYSRIQGGTNAIIIDPKPGDIGVAIFADRDISAVKKTKKRSNPGSRRKHSFADGLYLFGVLNGTPVQYIQYLDTGINIVDVNGNKIEMTSTGIKLTDKTGHVIDMNATNIAITGDVAITGKISSTQDASFAGGSQAVKLADGSNATKVKAT